MGFGFDPNKLRKKMEEQAEKKSGSKKKDPRFLNYYDLPENGTMEVRFLPANDDGELYVNWKQHGGNIRGVKNIRCSYESNGESCPVCQHSWELYEAGDKENNKKWIADEKFLAQVLVERSDIEIPVAEDGNPIKIMYLPVKIKDKLYDDITNGIVDDPSERTFVIKKTKNAGGFPAYEKSFFKGKDTPLSDEILDSLEGHTLYDLTEEVPAATTSAEMEEWFAEAQEKANSDSKGRTAAREEESKPAPRTTRPAATSNADAEPEPEQKTSARSALDRLRSRKS